MTRDSDADDLTTTRSDAPAPSTRQMPPDYYLG
ncbi:hypothetical protein ABIE44_002072 [Marmoricola sp. OAE513]